MKLKIEFDLEQYDTTVMLSVLQQFTEVVTTFPPGVPASTLLNMNPEIDEIMLAEALQPMMENEYSALNPEQRASLPVAARMHMVREPMDTTKHTDEDPDEVMEVATHSDGHTETRLVKGKASATAH